MEIIFYAHETFARVAAPALLAKLDDGDEFSSTISSDEAISSAGIDLPIQNGDDDDEAEPHVQLRVVLQGAEPRESARGCGCAATARWMTLGWWRLQSG